MALNIERLSVEQLAMERSQTKAKAALLPASTVGQRLLRDMTMALVESRKVGFQSFVAVIRIFRNFLIIFSIGVYGIKQITWRFSN
jgi:hypothetical protein